MSMSMKSRRKYLNTMREHYKAASTRAEKTRMIDEVIKVIGYHRSTEVYGLLDAYANLFLPMRKVVFKERHGAKVRKRYDIARTPFQRSLERCVER